MKKIKLKIFIVVLAFIFCGVLDHANAFAERAISLSPMSQRVILTPGETYRGSIKVANPVSSDDDIRYRITIGSFSPKKTENSKDDYGDASLNEITERNAIMDWIIIDDPSGILAPNEERTISFSIEVPQNAPAGGQYATLLVSEDKDEGADEGNTAINEVMQMAHVLYAEVTGTVSKKANIVENDVPSFSTTGEIETYAMVQNNGNVHADAELVLQIWPLFSEEEICTNEENPETTLVLPDTKRFFSHKCNLPMFGIFRAKQTVRIFGEESVVEKTIIVCPIWLLFIILFVIILFVIWIFTRTKSKKSSKKAEN